MKAVVENLEFFAAFSLAVEVAFETLFSLPGVEGFFESRKKERAYIKRVVVLGFCLALCAALYAFTEPGAGALFLERTFGRRIPVADVVLTGLILAGGSRAVHDVLRGARGPAAAAAGGGGKP